jgi:DNA-binding CsgD family transcriptional regulator
MRPFNKDTEAAQRSALAAEAHFPQRGQALLRALEVTRHSEEVWQLLLDLGRDVGLPNIDYILASDWHDWKRTQMMRTSYDATFLHRYNDDPELSRWSYFRSHGVFALTPICVGWEFVDDYLDLPEARREVLREAAARGLRGGLSIPIRQVAPPSVAMLTFTGDLDRAAVLEILARESWTLTVGAWAANQRFLLHHSAEFLDRNAVTEKQRELLEMVGAGLQDRDIAERLQVSISAVRQRMQALMAKTETTNRAELAALAMSLGLLPDPFNRPEHPPALSVLSDAEGAEE